MKRLLIIAIGVILVGLWLGIPLYTIQLGLRARDCHIQLCHNEGLNSTITSLERFYYYSPPDTYVSCYTENGGYTLIHEGEDILQLCFNR